MTPDQQFYLSMATLIATLITTVVTLFLRGKVDEVKSDVASVKTDAARSGLKMGEIIVTTSNTQRMGEAVHTLVNNSMGSQLRINSAALQRIADLTQDPDDITLAKESAQLLKEHLARQAVVNGKPPPTATASGKATGTPMDQASSEPHVAELQQQADTEAQAQEPITNTSSGKAIRVVIADQEEAVTVKLDETEPKPPAK